MFDRKICFYPMCREVYAEHFALDGVHRVDLLDGVVCAVLQNLPAENLAQRLRVPGKVSSVWVSRHLRESKR